MVKTLVVGASLNPSRYSNLAMHRLMENNIDTVGFGVKKGTVSGVQIKDNFADFQNIDTVTLYLNPTKQEKYYKDILALNPRRIIFNPGTENTEFYKILREAGIQVEIACTLVLLATGQY